MWPHNSGVPRIPDLIRFRYNSIIYDTLGSNDYIQAIASPNFLAGAPWSPDIDGSITDGNLISFSDYQKNPNDLVRLENSECIKTYATNYVSQYSDVILMTDRHTESNESSIYSVSFIMPLRGIPNWYCSHSMSPDEPCTPHNALAYADNWTIYISAIPVSDSVYTYNPVLLQVQYCLASPAATQSFIEINPGILLGVVICNVIKIICFVLTLTYAFRDHQPLITTGDAVESFLAYPEQLTAGNSVLAADDVKKGSWKRGKASTTWKPKRRFWFGAASAKRWILLSIL